MPLFLLYFATALFAFSSMHPMLSALCSLLLVKLHLNIRHTP